MFLKAAVKVVLTFAATASIPTTAAMIESGSMAGNCRHVCDFADGRRTYTSRRPEAAMAQAGCQSSKDGGALTHWRPIMQAVIRFHWIRSQRTGGAEDKADRLTVQVSKVPYRR